MLKVEIVLTLCLAKIELIKNGKMIKGAINAKKSLLI